MKLSIKVHPNSKKSKIEKDILGMLHVYIHEPPLKNRANQAVVDALAAYFQVKKKYINILSGVKSKNKIINIESV